MIPGRHAPRAPRFGAAAAAATLALAGLAIVAPVALPAAVSSAPSPARDSSAQVAPGSPGWSPPPRPAAPPPPPAAPGAAIYLTAHAPYGQPGWTDRLTAACGDSTAKDTLYMCFETGRDAMRFVGLSATINFRAAGRDTLDPHWLFGEGMGFRRLKVEFAPDAVPGTQRAWTPSSVQAASYSTTTGTGTLKMIVAGPAGTGLSVKDGTLYVVARILVPRPALRAPGCDGPLCIEWATASLAYGVGDLQQVSRGQRFVTWNSPGGGACAARRMGAPPPWHPPGR